MNRRMGISAVLIASILFSACGAAGTGAINGGFAGMSTWKGRGERDWRPIAGLPRGTVVARVRCGGGACGKVGDLRITMAICDHHRVFEIERRALTLLSGAELSFVTPPLAPEQYCFDASLRTKDGLFVSSEPSTVANVTPNGRAEITILVDKTVE